VNGAGTAVPTLFPPITAGRRPWRLVERNALAYRRMWFVFLSGFAEPVLFLLSIGIGVGELVGDLTVGGQVVEYQAFVAPGLLAAAAMNGAALDTTFNFFVKFKYSHTYDAVLATPVGVADVAVGEVTWALMRGAVYSTGFLVTMLCFGLVESWWAVLAIPAAVLIGFAFAGAGLACSTYMRSFVDFDFVNLTLVLLFLFSATFFPLTRYPGWLETIIRLTPLYQGVVLERSLVFGELRWSLLVNAAYLVAVGWIGVNVASKRIGRLLQP
jgi:lipooligosaccharide transport system permease protein